ncbi:MAG: hypothetical protein ACI90V_013157, partial [Bacillariaceae sp.]
MCEGVVPNRTIANKQKIKNKQNNNNNNNDRHKNSKLDTTTTTTTTKSKNDLPWYNRHGEIFSLRNLPAVLNASIMFVAIPN